MTFEEKIRLKAQVVKAIKVALRMNPKLRVGQLIMTAASELGVRGDLFEVEDQVLLEALEAHIIKLRKVEQRQRRALSK